jgi:glucose/arabinose dehydrogenase
MLRAPVLALAVAFLACDEAEPPGPDPDPVDSQPALRLVAGGFGEITYLTAPAGDARLFVVERVGRIRIIRDGQTVVTPFLDITARVGSNGSEQGLLSLAFHPSYAQNGFFFVNFTDRNGDTRVERYRVSTDPDRADEASAKLIVAIDQPFSNHNGGLVMFGPDGMLYIGMGDGGSGGDPMNHAQNRGTLLGDLLRIDVDAGDPYAIPADNPYTASPGSRPEIWASGLRNPWRFAFDPPANRLYIADVGQNQWEEINSVDARAPGLNYGWRILEGTRCYGAGSCSTTGMTLPVVEYSHSDGCSVTGGFVYRGTRSPQWAGHYFYSDYCSGWIRSFRMNGNSVTDQRTWNLDNVGRVFSFGRDAAGELYVLAVSSGSGSVYHLSLGQ